MCVDEQVIDHMNVLYLHFFHLLFWYFLPSAGACACVGVGEEAIRGAIYSIRKTSSPRSSYSSQDVIVLIIIFIASVQHKAQCVEICSWVTRGALRSWFCCSWGSLESCQKRKFKKLPDVQQVDNDVLGLLLILPK